MKFAFTIGSYRLCDFVKLNILQLRRLCPEADILISDDPSPESPFMETMAKDFGVAYLGARERRGHFGGDVQALINSIAFAEACGADVAVKISQRLVFRRPEAVEVLRKTFEDQSILFATPGKPAQVRGRKETMGFGRFAVLSDLVCFRTGSIRPEEVIELYRHRIQTEIVPWKDFIEALVHTLHLTRYEGKSSYLPKLTDPGDDPLYLRRYQATEGDYHRLAAEHGFAGKFPMVEWNRIDQRNYQVKAVVV